MAPGIEVTLVERDSKFITCPFSNAVLGGLYDMGFITHGCDALRGSHGVRVIHDVATSIDADARQVALAGGETQRPETLRRLIPGPVSGT